MKRQRAFWAVMISLAVVMGIGVAGLWLLRDSFRSPADLYAEARHSRSERAMELFEVLGRRLPEIEEYGQLWEAEAAIPGIDAFRSLQSLAQYRPNSPLAYLAHLQLARYYASIDSASAEQDYLAALSLYETPALRLELARFYEERGDREGAYDQYRRLLSVKPDAFVGMRRNATDVLQLAEDLNTATYFSDALEVLRGLEDPQSSRLRGWALLGLGDYQAATSELETWLESDTASNEDLLRLGQALAGAGRTEEAIALYGSIGTFDSELAQARLLEDVSPDDAIDLYLSVPYPVAWWNATWILEAQGRIEEALPVYADIAASGASFADDAAYRLLVLAERLGDRPTSVEGRQLLGGFGLDWLALRAGAMEGELAVGPSVEPQAPEILSKVAALDGLGRQDLTDLELVFCGQYRRQLPVRMACLQELVARGHLLEAQAIAADYVEDGGEAPMAMWELAYPRPYAEAVATSAEEFAVDSLLIWAVMRVESRYDPSAVSSAGARGLMQIIPETEDWIGEQLGLELVPGDIYLPEVNIGLGTWYLRNLLDEFHGDLELAIVAYNGGPLNVREWLADPMVSNRDDFIRWVGYGETREYLERVSIAYWAYQQIYSQ